MITASSNNVSEFLQRVRLKSLDLLRLLPQQRIDCKQARLELVSLHIPKTAGTSFGNILKSVYGSKFLQIHIRTRHSPAQKIPGRTSVIHGHFRYRDLVSRFDIDRDTRMVVWVRDPVERLMSEYFYFQQIIRKSIKRKYQHLKTLDRMEKTLLEFAGTKKNRNRMSRFLEGISLADLFFIGIQEYFSEDVADLAQMLHWNKFLEFRHNSSLSQRVVVDEVVKQEIRRLNEKDWELYREALVLREKRRKNF